MVKKPRHKRNSQEAKAKKPRPRSQGKEEMGEKKMDDKQKPIKHNKKTV